MKLFPSQQQGSAEALLGALLTLAFLFWTTHAVHTPTPTQSSTTQNFSCTAAAAASQSQQQQQQQGQSPWKDSSVFGVSKRIPAALAVRGGGGQVLEPSSLQDVESILLRAGSENKLVVIDFSATWCGPCKMIAPLFQELSEKMPDVVFMKIDVDENPDTAAKYNVSAMPTFVFVKQGVVVDRLMGANPSRLQELLQEHK